MTGTTPTGIAGAADHAPSHAKTCYVCQAAMPFPRAMRSLPGIGLVGVCSKACMEHDAFRPAADIEVDRLRAQIAAIQEPFPPRTYAAKQHTVYASGFRFDLSGTLDGWIDFAITCSDGSHLTYQITRDDARATIAALHAVVKDITANCLFDRDPLLMPEADDV